MNKLLTTWICAVVSAATWLTLLAWLALVVFLWVATEPRTSVDQAALAAMAAARAVAGYAAARAVTKVVALVEDCVLVGMRGKP